MPQKIYQNIISLTSVAILIAVVFSCQIGIWNLFFPIPLDTPHHQMASSSDCCQAEHNQGTTVPISDTDGNIFTLPDNRLSLVTVTFLFLLISISFLWQLRSRIIGDYLKNIRLKYGGFKLFYYFSYLFSSGIINPKIY